MFDSYKDCLTVREGALCLVTLYTHVYGAAHQRASLQGLLHDAVQVLGGITQVKVLGHAPREVLHGLQGVATFQSLVGAVQPEVGACVHHHNTSGVAGRAPNRGDGRTPSTPASYQRATLRVMQAAGTDQVSFSHRRPGKPEPGRVGFHLGPSDMT